MRVKKIMGLIADDEYSATADDGNCATADEDVCTTVSGDGSPTVGLKWSIANSKKIKWDITNLFFLIFA